MEMPMTKMNSSVPHAVTAALTLLTIAAAATASQPVSETLVRSATREAHYAAVASQSSIRGFLGERTIGNTIRPLPNERLTVEVYRGGRMIQRVYTRTGSDGRFTSRPSSIRSGDSVKVITQRRFSFRNGLLPITWYGVHPNQTADVRMIYYR
jgi:hypothetical protein